MTIGHDFEQALNLILRQVDKPGRYVGGEMNQIVKPPHAVEASILLAFPDVYDIGMSYHGFKILYERVNAVRGWAAERAFAPWPDMEALMREAGLPLYALESKRPALAFDYVGFTLQHELNYTNALNMIDLAGAAVEAAERPDPFPLFIGGGEGALAPEPLAPFLDLFVVGDGEEPLDALMALAAEFKREGGAKADPRRSKAALLRRAACIPGVYVPSLIDFEYGGDGTPARIVSRETGEEARPVRKAIYSLGADLGPVRPVVPNMRIIHDRLAIEIKRGCSRGCRFCSAGMIARPVRERTPDQILDIARQGLARTGFDEISLLSLSSADYSCILPAVRMLRREFARDRVSISLPSLRVNAFDVELAGEIAQVRKSGFTFAPEAGTDRLRRVINKPLENEHFLRVVEDVCRRGWRTLKFYFMIGLPTETDEDLQGIVDLVRQAERAGRSIHGKALTINVGLSPFTPKPHTPFQWAAQLPMEELERRHRLVARELQSRQISIKGHDRRMSWLEAALARGDRRMAAALKRAWQLGAAFDGWDERFNFAIWTRAFEETGIDPAFYANRERAETETLPWDHIDSGPGKDFLLKEWRLARQGRSVPDCAIVGCAGCAVCGGGVDHCMADEIWRAPIELAGSAAPPPGRPPARKSKDGTLHERLRPLGELPSPGQEPETDAEQAARGGRADAPSAPAEGKPSGKRSKPRPPRNPLQEEPAQRILFRYRRTGGLRFLSHLDFLKILTLACSRSRLPVAFSEGFNPTPRLRFLPPLPLGFESLDEVFDAMLTRKTEPRAAMDRLNAALPDGFRIESAETIPLRAASPEERMIASTFRLRVPAGLLREGGYSPGAIGAALRAFEQAREFPAAKPFRPGKPARTIDLKKCVMKIGEPRHEAAGMELDLTLSQQEGNYLEPIACLNAMLGAQWSFALGIDAARIETRLKE